MASRLTGRTRPTQRTSPWLLHHDVFLFKSVDDHPEWQWSKQVDVFNEKFDQSYAETSVRNHYNREVLKNVDLELLLYWTQHPEEMDKSEWTRDQDIWLLENAPPATELWQEVEVRLNRQFRKNRYWASIKSHYLHICEQGCTLRNLCYNSSWPIQQDVFVFECITPNNGWIARAAAMNQKFGVRLDPESVRRHYQDLVNNDVTYAFLLHKKAAYRI